MVWMSADFEEKQKPLDAAQLILVLRMRECV